MKSVTLANLLQVFNLIFLSIFVYYAIMLVVCERLKNNDISKMRNGSLISFIVLIVFFGITKFL